MTPTPPPEGTVADGMRLVERDLSAKTGLALLAQAELDRDPTNPHLIAKLSECTVDVQALAKALRVLDERAADEQARGTAPRAFEMSDLGNAEMLAYIFGDKIRYDTLRNSWFIWRRHRWVEDRYALIHHYAVVTVRTRKGWAFDEKEEKAFARKSASDASLNALVSRASKLQALIVPEQVQWDTTPHLLGCLNGVLDLNTGILRDGKPDDYISKTCGLDYDPDAKCPRWEAFQREIFLDENNAPDEALIRWRQMNDGYDLSASIKEEVSVLDYGEGGNGKSARADTKLAVFGQYGYRASDALMLRAGNRSYAGDIAALEGKRFVVVSETNKNQRFDEARYKRLIADPTLNGRHPYGREFTFRNVSKFLQSTNHLPQVDDGQGFWRRIRPVEFRATFIGREDRDLRARLFSERTGILAWMVRGYQDWLGRPHGLQPLPGAIDKSLERYRKDQSPEVASGYEAFIDLAALLGDFKTSAKVLHDAYLAFAEKEQIPRHRRLTMQMFGRMLGKRFTKVQERTGNFYLGIAVVE
jgi:putative DNA primase/helicase